jgi:signal transduction histidine kinase
MSERLKQSVASKPATPELHAQWDPRLHHMMAAICAEARSEAHEPHWQQIQRIMLVGLMASSYIHDLNNLLTIIEGGAVLAADDLSADHPAQENLSAVHQASRAARDLSRRLSAFLRRQPIAPRPVDLYKLALEWEPLLERVLSATAHLKTRLDPDLWTVCADPVQIEQVVLNLVVNARDAMPTGGAVELSWSNVWLEADEALPAGGYICLTVSDSGVGMEPEVLERLFEPFFSTKKQPHGLGLGLATCHRIVAELGGAIRVESVPGYGSTFRVYLPRYVG